MRRKEIASEFLRLAAHGNPAEAFRLHVAPSFRHHNAFYKGDAQSLLNGMQEAALQHPHIVFTIHHMIEENDLVSAHSHFQVNPEHAGVAVTHIFRFEGDKIAELWDFGQEIPEDMVNENGMF